MEKDNTTVVLTRLIKELAIPVTRQSITDELEKHPDKGSIKIFSDVLDHWRVPNAVYQPSISRLAEIPLPFIAHISKNEYAVITELDEKQLTLSNQQYDNKVFTTDEFSNIYLGSVLTAEKTEDSGERGYVFKRRKEIIDTWRLPVVLSTSVILLIGFLAFSTPYFSGFNLQLGLLTLFKTAGLAVTVLLLVRSIDANNPLIQKLCGGDSKQNCNAILSSPAAKMTREISWGEMGYFYFAGTWLVLLFCSGHTAIMQALAILNIIGLPYTFYSIYYQWRVAKQWCVLCCTVQALLWLEFVAFVPYLTQSLRTPNLKEEFYLITGMLIPVLAWVYLKPVLLKAKQAKHLKKSLNKLKYNAGHFEKELNDGAKHDLLSEEDTIIIGNPEAEHIITMVSNPYCGPCANTHKKLDEWLARRNDIKLQVIFSVDNKQREKNIEVIAHLMALRENNDGVTLSKALTDWYEQKDKSYTAWAKLYPKTGDAVIEASLKKHSEWCRTTHVRGTPTLFINGRRLPKTYKAEDLEYLM